MTLKSHVSKMLQVSSKPLGPSMILRICLAKCSLRNLSAHDNPLVTCVLSLHREMQYIGYRLNKQDFLGTAH